MASVKRMSDKEKDEAEKLAEIEGSCGGDFLFVFTDEVLVVNYSRNVNFNYKMFVTRIITRARSVTSHET